MKTPLSFYLVAAAAGMLACSDGGTDRDPVRSGGGSAGQSQVGNAGSSAGGSSGSGSQSTAGAGGTGSGNTATPFEITAATPTATGASALVVDSGNNTGIDG